MFIGNCRKHLDRMSIGFPPTKSGVDYKLLWPEGLGFPFIIHSKGHSVKGEVYNFSEDTIRFLDRIEGVEGGLYEKRIVSVIMDNGDKIDALTYVGGESLQTYRHSSSYSTVIPEEFEKG